MSAAPYRVPNNRPYQLGFRLWQTAGAARLPIVLKSASGFLAAPSAPAGAAPIAVPTSANWNVAALLFGIPVVGQLATGIWNGAVQWVDQTGAAGEADFTINLFAGVAPVAGAPLAPGRSVDVDLASGSIDLITLDAGPPGGPGPDFAALMFGAGLISAPTPAAVVAYYAALTDQASNASLSATAQAAIAKLGVQATDADTAIAQLASLVGRVFGVADLSDPNQSGSAPAL